MRHLSTRFGSGLRRVFSREEFQTRLISPALTRCCSKLGVLVDDFDRGHDISFWRDKFNDVVGSAKQFSEGFENREKLFDLLPKSQEELPAKSMKDALQVAWLKLSDPEVKEKYVSFNRSIRLGRILEDLDTFAACTAFMHNNTGTDIDSYKSPLVIVTAMVDQIDVRQAIIDPNRDLRMVGYVSWAGSTSMEITMKLQQQPE